MVVEYLFMTVLKNNADVEVNYHSLLLVSIGIVSLMLYLFFENLDYFVLTPSVQPEQKLVKKSIYVVMNTLPPQPKAAKKERLKVQKELPIVKKPTPVKKKVVQTVVKKRIKKEPIKEKTVPLAKPKEVVKEVARVAPIESSTIASTDSSAQSSTTASKASSKSIAGEGVKQGDAQYYAEKKVNFIRGLYAILNKNKYYPRIARLRHRQGTVYIHFTLLKNGTVKNVYISKSCGYNSLDNATLQLVKSIKKYKPIPDEISQVTLDLEIPIIYSLKENH